METKKSSIYSGNHVTVIVMTCEITSDDIQQYQLKNFSKVNQSTARYNNKNDYRTAAKSSRKRDLP